MNTPANFAYQFDVMGRPGGLTETYCSGTDQNGNCVYSTAPRLQTALYNAAGQMTSLVWAYISPWQTESFT